LAGVELINSSGSYLDLTGRPSVRFWAMVGVP